MHVYVFKGADRIIGFTAQSSGDNLPPAQGPWQLMNRLDMSKADDPRPLVDTRECLEDIEMHGFHITDDHRRITDALEP